jgi:hypothetical protein
MWNSPKLQWTVTLVNTEKTKYTLLSRHQIAGQNRDIKISNRCSENVAQFRYLGPTITNQNLIQEEIKRSLKLGNACYHPVQNSLSFRLLPKSIKIRIYKIIILPVGLYGVELGLWHYGRSRDCGRLRTGYWGEYIFIVRIHFSAQNLCLNNLLV